MDNDEARLNDLFDRCEAQLFGFLLSLVTDLAEAEDLLQESFLRALKSREVTFDRRASFKTWIYRIARNPGLDPLALRVR